MSSYVLSAAARLDLLEIFVYLERQSPSAAVRVERLLMKELDDLALLPVRYRSRPLIVPLPFRVHVAGKYLVIYNPEGTPMKVARVLHGSRGCWDDRERFGSE